MSAIAAKAAKAATATAAVRNTCCACCHVCVADAVDAANAVNVARHSNGRRGLNVFAPEYIPQFTDMSTISNHRKRWTVQDDKILKDFADKNQVITYSLVSEIANKLKRTHYAIRVRMMKNYVLPNYDYVDYENEDLYNKFVFAGRDSIDNLAYANYSKKDKILVKLDRMSRMIDVDNVTTQDELLELIDQITELSESL
jgi:hypothetical protein